MRVLTVINPKAGLVAKKGSVLAGLSGHETVPLEPDFGAVDDQLTANLTGIDAVAIEGGDGTVRAVTASLIRLRQTGRALPPVVTVPGGTTDLVARVVGVERSAEAVNAALTSGAPTSLPLLTVRHGDVTEHGFFLVGGAIARAIFYCREAFNAKGARGTASIAATIAALALGTPKSRRVLRAGRAEIRIGDLRIGPSARFCLVTTLPRLMAGFDPFWGTGDGPVRATVAKSDSDHLWRTVARLRSGRRPEIAERHGYVSKRTDALEIAGGHPLILDGERVHPAGSLRISASAPLTFLRAA